MGATKTGKLQIPLLNLAVGEYAYFGITTEKQTIEKSAERLGIQCIVEEIPTGYSAKRIG